MHSATHKAHDKKESAASRLFIKPTQGEEGERSLSLRALSLSLSEGKQKKRKRTNVKLKLLSL